MRSLTFHHATIPLGVCAAVCRKADLRLSASMMAKKEDSSERKSAIVERAIDLSIHRAFHFSSDRASLSIFMQRSQKRLSQTFATIRSHGKETSRKKPTVRYRRDRYRRERGVISSRVCLSAEKSLAGARARACTRNGRDYAAPFVPLLRGFRGSSCAYR